MANKDTQPNPENLKETPTSELPLDAHPGQEKVFFTWQSASRSYKEKNNEFWVRVIVIASIFGFILFIAEGVMPVILLITVTFLYYVLSTVKPEVVEYKITNRGIKIAQDTNYWESLTGYWFSKRLEDDILVLSTINAPGRLEVLINAKDKDTIKKYLTQYLEEMEAPNTNFDKASDWVSKKLT